MLALDATAVRIGASPSDKTEAIRQVAKLLVDSGNIEPAYIDSMLARERVANTFLGNGIAIPHGIPKDRELIRETGVAVLQVPAGVEWNPGEKVHLVVGIAAQLRRAPGDLDQSDRRAERPGGGRAPRAHP